MGGRFLISLGAAMLLCVACSRGTERRRASDDSNEHRASEVDEEPRELEERPVSARRRLTGYEAPGEMVDVPSKSYPGGLVAVTLPLDYDEQPQKSYPLLVAFGGAGESARPARDNALAWMEYYDADEALVALRRGGLKASDFRELVTKRQLDRFNKRLERQPYRGVILACPASPMLSRSFPLASERYESFIMNDVLPTLRERFRITPGKIGVDGVSMGGARSLYFGLAHPEVFRSIGGLQGAFARHMPLYRQLIERNRETLAQRPIQLVTSDGDGLAPAVRLMHGALDAADIEHRYQILTGPHDYVFNQGPGVLSMLLFHDSALRE
jgi:iron(III)-salmochelin esterase